MRFGHDPGSLERVLAIDLGVRWDIGAPSPHLVQSESRTFLTFFLHDPDPAWDGTWVTVVDPAGDQVRSIGVIEWLGCDGAVLGGLNDEAMHGHPLYSRGLGEYKAFEVQASQWVSELERANSVHPHHRPEEYAQLRHYLLGFHDSTFECIARAFASYSTRSSMSAVLASLARSVLDRDLLPFVPVLRSP